MPDTFIRAILFLSSKPPSRKNRPNKVRCHNSHKTEEERFRFVSLLCRSTECLLTLCPCRPAPGRSSEPNPCPTAPCPGGVLTTLGEITDKDGAGGRSGRWESRVRWSRRARRSPRP